MSDTKRLSVTLIYEYDVNPEHYPKSHQTPLNMAELDIEGDPSVILDAEWKIKEATFRDD